MIDETEPFDARYFRPLMVTLRVALHNITAHLLHVIFFFEDIIETKFRFISFSLVMMNHVQ